MSDNVNVAAMLQQDRAHNRYIAGLHVQIAAGLVGSHEYLAQAAIRVEPEGCRVSNRVHADSAGVLECQGLSRPAIL
jgi:hypothetical protein